MTIILQILGLLLSWVFCFFLGVIVTGALMEEIIDEGFDKNSTFEDFKCWLKLKLRR